MKGLMSTTLALALAFSGAAIAEPVTYQLDPNHTMVTASWSHFGYSHPVAHFGDVDGTLVYDPQNPSASSVDVTLPLSGLDAHVPDFNEHLRSADFFAADKYPTITFDSTAVEAVGDGQLKVTGDLTLHGVTRPVVLDVTVNKVGEHPASGRAAAGFDATTTIKRSDFGLGKYVPNVSDAVEIRITAEAMVPKAADDQPAAEAADAG